MRELIEYITKQIVKNPDDVVVEESNEDGVIQFVLKVNPKDMGLIIGKNGQTIKAMRKLLTVRAMADNVRVNLRLHDENPRGLADEEIAPVADDSPTKD